LIFSSVGRIREDILEASISEGTIIFSKLLGLRECERRIKEVP
jgi:hypothetical protein